MPEIWDSDGSEFVYNTCYAYIANDPETKRTSPDTAKDYSADVGINTGKCFTRSRRNHKTLRAYTKDDGLIFAGRKLPKAKPGCYIVAAFTALYPFMIGTARIRTKPSIKERRSDRIYHFYRLDRNGTWSHKSGLEAPENNHEDLPEIHSARGHAAKHSYYDDMQFVGYFYLPNSGIILGEREDISCKPTSSEANRKTSFRAPDLIEQRIFWSVRRDSAAR